MAASRLLVFPANGLAVQRDHQRQRAGQAREDLLGEPGAERGGLRLPVQFPQHPPECGTATAGPAGPTGPCGHPRRALLRLRQAALPLPRGPPALHGPYAEWTRKLGGKTVARRLTPGQLAAWQPLLDNARKIRELLAELQELTLQAVDTDIGDNH